ncbi:MAG: hypothetical protein ACREUU_05635, partial [Gammaproteobacteria bacterium]
VAVNGKPAKGTLVQRASLVNLTPNARSGQAIADTERAILTDATLEILQPDGTPIGTIMLGGLILGPPAPGAPLTAISSNVAVTGGTGAFFGVRGQSANGVPPVNVNTRFASVSEDPANRRTYGGGTLRLVLHLIPLARPEILATQAGPAVVHANDFSLVSASRPARPGEILSLFTSGLGPTRPGVDPGKPFPSAPLHVVNSPVEVSVSGAPAEVLYAGGYSGAVDVYQVNFRMPAETTRGTVAIRLSVAWIAGPEARIAVQ